MGNTPRFEDCGTRGCIFENERRRFRTRERRALAPITAGHAHDRPGRHQVAVKGVDI